jgi:hypothetical protein
LTCADLQRSSGMGQVLFVHNEADLVAAARAGDGSGYAELVRPHYQAAFRVAYGLPMTAGHVHLPAGRGFGKPWPG